MSKYNQTKICLYCQNEFITKPRYIDFCSQSCKNPNNRPGVIPWNKGLKLTEEQKSRQNVEGLKKGHGWNKGLPNERQRLKWLEDNPNKDGKVNNKRPKNYIDTEFTAYKREVKKATYRTVYAMEKQGLVPKNRGKRKNQYQLDHIIPYKQGFDLGIDPKIIGSPRNLRWILGEENRRKWDTYQPNEIVKQIKGD